MNRIVLCIVVLALANTQSANAQRPKFDRQDRLRGSITPERQWWDLRHYHLKVEVFPETKSLKGSNRITFVAVQTGSRMQIDLQKPLRITQVVWQNQNLEYSREGNVYWIQFSEELQPESRYQIEVFYEGVPTESTNPPWQGGLSWEKDEKGNDFIVTTCQGIGASIWWPNKDHGYDEPDEGMRISVTVPEQLKGIANGRLQEVSHDQLEKKKTFHWEVTHPINNYCVNLNIGNYVNFSETFQGEKGPLKMDYWVLEHQRELAMKHFREAPRTIRAFEHWFGPYPFYEDSYKLVVVPYPGMEHQSSVTYGNGFKNGYRGRDLSDTGVGFKFDFIIVHETGHEWFGNNISMRDAADMWIHESFTNYSENLFVEFHFSEKEAQDYVIGCRALIQNDRPIVGIYNVNYEGSGDMYYKGGNMLHTIRHIINDDEKWRSILRGLNEQFRHQTVTTEQVESYMIKRAGIDLQPVFDQYLRDTRIPILKIKRSDKSLMLHFDGVIESFFMPVELTINGQSRRLSVSTSPQEVTWPEKIKSVEVDRNFYLISEISD